MSDDTSNDLDNATEMGLAYAMRLGIKEGDPRLIPYLEGILEVGAIYEILKDEVPHDKLFQLSSTFAEIRGNEYNENLPPPDLEELVEHQVMQAKSLIAEGKNYQPQLVMRFKDRLAIAIVPSGPPGTSPMDGAIVTIESLRPDAYTFGSEVWMATSKKDGIPGDYERMKELATQHRLHELDTKIEGFVVIGAENDGQMLTRFFTIDRINKRLDKIEDPGMTMETRLPKKW